MCEVIDVSLRSGNALVNFLSAAHCLCWLAVVIEQSEVFVVLLVGESTRLVLRLSRRLSARLGDRRRFSRSARMWAFSPAMLPILALKVLKSIDT